MFAGKVSQLQIGVNTIKRKHATDILSIALMLHANEHSVTVCWLPYKTAPSRRGQCIISSDQSIEPQACQCHASDSVWQASHASMYLREKIVGKLAHRACRAALQGFLAESLNGAILQAHNGQHAMWLSCRALKPCNLTTVKLAYRLAGCLHVQVHLQHHTSCRQGPAITLPCHENFVYLLGQTAVC